MVTNRKLNNDKHICYRRHVNSCELHDWPSVSVCCDQTGYVCHVLPVYFLLVHMCICVYVCVCVCAYISGRVSYWYMSMVVHVCVVVYM